mmetsp:Transcript_19503/g.52382  ORF Transcript_19503/g.52382 Transcript_19503/m.52382 type:complete len:201 (-) Transcript_19503:483-1085(-)
MRVEPPTSTISSIWFFLRPESSKTCLTGPMVFLNRSALISSKRARESVSEKSTPSKSPSISMRACCVELRARFVFSTSRRSFWIDFWFLDMSLPCFFWKILTKCAMTRWSKSSPPRCVSPLVATTSNTPLSMVSKLTSKVPPPRSYTRMFFSVFLSRPYAMAAAVGSLMMRRMFIPEMVPASFVDCLCASLKYAGTVTTA